MPQPWRRKKLTTNSDTNLSTEVRRHTIDLRHVGSPRQNQSSLKPAFIQRLLSKLKELRELASNARKFGRHAEAETHYSAICTLDLTSAEEIVNTHLFLAECQAKQGKDYAGTLQALNAKVAQFTQLDRREYGAYRTAKFYEMHGQLDKAELSYGALVSSGSTSTWVAASLYKMAGVKEQLGDLESALQLYLQYPQRFPRDSRLALQSRAAALNVASALSDTVTVQSLLSQIETNAENLDYRTCLQLAWHYHKNGHSDLAESYLLDLSLADFTGS